MSCFANRHYNYTCQISIKMKASNVKKFKLLIGLIIISFISLAQSPESMNYQAVIRNSSGNIIANQSIGIRIKILQGSANGSTVYNETFTPTSNAYGMVSLQIGTGFVVSGSFSSIDWGNNSYFVETAADVLGGSNYSVISTTQFMSVPYALYAKTSGSNYVDNSNNISIGSNNPSNFTFNSGNNINLGPQTGQEIYSGANNFYAGPAAGRYQEGVSNNIAIGLEALRGGNNTGQGRSNNSIALGNSAGVLSQGDQNIFIGKSSGYVTTSTNGRNIAIGADALNSGNHHNPYTGDNLICIGDNTQPSSLSASNEITLGDDNISSFRIPGIQSGKSSGDVLTFDGSKLILQTPSSSGSSSSSSSNGYSGNIPNWIYNTGTCSDDLPDVFQSTNSYNSTGNLSLSGTVDYCNFTLNAGHTLNISGYLILRVADTLTINGNIDGDGGGNTQGDGGASGGAGGSCSGGWWGAQNHNSSGGSGNNAVISYSHILNQNTLCGDKGGNGHVKYYQNNSCGINEGANGGSGFVIICNYLKFNGNISLRGGDGFSSSSNNCVKAGSGGGGGGSIIINAQNVLNNTGVINVNGGLGGSSVSGSVGGYTITGTSGSVGGNGYILWLGEQ